MSMRTIRAGLLAGVAAGCLTATATATAQPPNILFIIADDMNDYIGCMGGHPQAITPNLDRLASRGVNFLNAASNYPLCSPARASLIYGLYPHTVNFPGGLKNGAVFYEGPFVRDRLNSYIDFFKKAGYAVYGAGKIYHNLAAPAGTWYDSEGKSIYSVPPNWGPSPGNKTMSGGKDICSRIRQYFAQGEFAGMQQRWTALPGRPFHRHPKHPDRFHSGVDYASLDEIPLSDDSDGWYLDGKPFRYVSEEDRDLMPDEKAAAYIAGLIEKGFDRPFMISFGIGRPHTPLYAPKKYFDLYPLATLQMPPGIKGGDISDIAEDLGRNRNKPKFRWGKHGFECHDLLNGHKNGEGLKEFLQAYLACISFADAQVGKVLDALEKSPYANNTLIVFTSDHGYHIGEKEWVFKGSLWEESCRVPLIIAGPGVKSGGICKQPVSLVDLYPTFLDYSGLTASPHKELGGPELDGYSLRPLLENPQGPWNGPEVSLSVVGNDFDHEHKIRADKWAQHYSVRSKSYRYIRTASGQEELYDMEADPHAWTNLAYSPEHRPVMDDLHRQMKELIDRSEPYDILQCWKKPQAEQKK
jgi:arylsulfatase A-like enzyme